jgi:exopolysaccharide biosynthesis polyprenyl glycosylphosphotransferase
MDDVLAARPADRGARARARRQPDVLSRQAFLDQLQLEKRRTDRSKVPLSLVLMRLVADGGTDIGDVRDILTELANSTRETDVIGYLGEGRIALLLPYSNEQAAETFSKQVLDRVDAPPVTIDVATYPDEPLESLLEAGRTSGEPIPLVIQRPTSKSRFEFTVKRWIDLVGASVLIVLASPLMLATALAVKLSSPGPVIFRQTRVGRGGKPFTFYKFRSMRVNNDDRVHREYVAKLIDGRTAEINQGDAAKPAYKMKSDPRITAVGRIIRKTSIDELPQLFNVLKGEMSLVGPRPPVTYEAENYQSWHMRRLQQVRPGMTGLWQVEGRSRTTFDEMVRLDLRYIRNWSLALDFRILLKTVGVVIRGDGAD